MDTRNKELYQLKQNSPRLQNKAKIRDRVLAQIELEDSARMHPKQLLVRIAASVFIALSVASYAWLETNTQYKRIETLASISNNYVPVEADMQCQYTMKSLITMLDQAGLEHILDGNTVRLTRFDFEYLKSNNSPLVDEVEQFLEALEKLHPQQYQSYLHGEGAFLTVWQLRSDQRICQWLN
ncbi:hypothetical protein [Carboxylicivirga sp. N1Y90]|uniref:hypothetical protein n=1 Tax=Carboxylicivirga fragile TaxID=3417571 RepID=UPI003D3577BD|nr:hypothetical protein [Marinilabiliaceae bacterium N1Y90]